jgi:hypothetical protein
MFSVCANPDCKRPFDWEQGRLFRFHKDYPVGGSPPNIHSVQHFWLCNSCSATYTLEYRDSRGVLIKSLPEATATVAGGTMRFIAAA